MATKTDYFADVARTDLMRVVVALATEVYELRDRQRLTESLLAAQGIKLDDLDAKAEPAVYDEARPNERRFALIARDDEEAINRRLERERRFDPDFWLVEIEVTDLDEAGRYFEIAAG
ncbi:MAG: DUF1491 family protein [Nitratireductor sp.]